MSKKKRYRPIIGITISKNLLEIIDQERGIIPRSKYIEKMLMEYLEGKGYKIRTKRRK